MAELTWSFVERASELFRTKTGMTRDQFDNLTNEMKTRAFTVAYVESVDRVKALQDLLNKAVVDGTTLAKFRKSAIDHIDTHPWHLETVFRTNVQSAYGAAHWESAQGMRSLRPYARYSAIMDGRTRPEHARLHGKVYPIDHPFWKRYWPPWDYNCRCGAVTLTQMDIEEAKITPEVALPDVRPAKDFTSPAAAGLKIDPDKFLGSRGLDVGSHMAAYARLSEELAHIERQRLPVTGTGPVGEYGPGMLPTPYVSPVSHEIGALPPWKPEMKASDIKKLFVDSKIKDPLYVFSGDYVKVQEWRKSGFTGINAVSKTPYFGEGAYFSFVKPSGPSIQVAVNVRNPYVFEWDGIKTSALTSRRGPLGTLLQAELQADPSLSRERAITRILQRLGYDGVAVTNLKTREMSVVVFDREQAAIVKTVTKKTTGTLTDAEYLVQLTKAQENALEFAKQCGKVPLSPLEQRVTAKLRQDIDSGDITVCVARKLSSSGASYADLYKNGRFKNQFELGNRATSSGCLAPYKGGPRDGWEKKLYGGALHKSPEYKNLSRYFSKDLAMERPIYGYLHTDMEYQTGGASQYGNVIFELRKESLQRISYTVGDSSHTQNKNEKGALLGRLDPIAKNLSGLNLTLENYVNGVSPPDQLKISGSTSYIECQILGGVDLKRGDVSKIMVYLRSYESESKFEHVRKLGLKYNIPVEFRRWK